jgi:dolichol kinase
MNLGVKIFAYAFIISLAGTLAEMLSIRGTDNFFIPLSVLVVLLNLHLI